MRPEATWRFLEAFARLVGGQREGLDIVALQGRDGYRLCIGAYRAMSELEGATLNVMVLDAGLRGVIYIMITQFIEADGKQAFAVVPIDDYHALLAKAEMLDDVGGIRSRQGRAGRR